MNKPAIALAVISVGLIGALAMSQHKAADQLSAAEAQAGSFSNRFTEAEMKLNHQERMNLALGGSLTNRADELAKAASDLTKARQQIAEARAETRIVQAQAQTVLGKLEGVRGESGALSNQIQELTATLAASEQQVRDARERQAAAEGQQQNLQQQLNVVNLELEKSRRLLQDPELLRGQISALKNQPASRTDQVKSARPDYHLPLELQPDGSVRAVSQK